MMAAAWTVYLKELVDALRDRRTLLVVPPAFEADLAAGLVPELLLVTSSAHQRAQGSAGSVAALLARTGHRDFEASFVQLAFGPAAAAAGFGASP